MTVSDTPIEPGGDGTSADPDLPDADAHMVKAELAARIDDIIRQRDLTEAEAGRLLGLSEPEISRLLRGDIREYSLERLLGLLIALNRDIDIVIRQPRSTTGGRLRVAVSETD